MVKGAKRVEEPVIRGVDHVAILVEDIDTAIPYYRDVLGMPVIGDELNDNVGVRLVYLDAGNIIIQLVSPFRAGPIQDHLTTRGEGLHHVCFLVEDIDPAIEDLAPGKAITVAIGGRNRRTCFLPDRPSGLIMELSEIDERAVERPAAVG